VWGRARELESTPERNVDDRDNDEVDESDPPLNVDDNKFMKPPLGEEDEEDDARWLTFLYVFDVYGWNPNNS